MQWSIRAITGLAVLALVAALTACGITSPTRSERTQEVQQEVQSAEQTLATFQSDPAMAWFRSNVNKARAIIIIPRVTRAAFVIGGSGGDALVLARDKQGQWLGPAFYRIGTGSVGFQAGVDVAEVIMLVMSEKGLSALLSPSFEFGGDASIAAGPVGLGTAATVTTDIVSFARAKGVYAGLSFAGTLVRPDHTANHVFYGQSLLPVDVLVRGNVHHSAAAPLQQSLTRVAK
jgi:lipid-binding SYLF domain-containing protein